LYIKKDVHRAAHVQEKAIKYYESFNKLKNSIKNPKTEDRLIQKHKKIIHELNNAPGYRMDKIQNDSDDDDIFNDVSNKMSDVYLDRREQLNDEVFSSNSENFEKDIIMRSNEQIPSERQNSSLSTSETKKLISNKDSRKSSSSNNSSKDLNESKKETEHEEVKNSDDEGNKNDTYNLNAFKSEIERQ
jgi:hypothetical protein